MSYLCPFCAFERGLPGVRRHAIAACDRCGDLKLCGIYPDHQAEKALATLCLALLSFILGVVVVGFLVGAWR